MKTGILIAFTIVVVLAVTSANARECTTGDVKQVECNTCRCLNGVWACTKMGCLSKRATECAPGETKRLDCNTCFCANGNWACTLKACLRKRAIPARFDEDTRRKRDTCTPGKTYKKDCNTCTCTSTGIEICTARACL